MSRRQIPRTPPPPDCTRRLDFETHQENESIYCTLPIGQDDPASMVKGMKNYQMTPADLEFIQRLKEEKELHRLQDEAARLDTELKRRQMALKFTLATKEKAEAELEQVNTYIYTTVTDLRVLPCSEDLRKWALVVLEKSEPSSSDMTDLDIRELLALITWENLRRVLKEKELQLLALEKTVAQRKEKDAEDRGLFEKRITMGKSKILGLMGTLAELKSSLAQQQELNESLKAQQGPEKKVKATEKPVRSGARSKAKPPPVKMEMPENPTSKPQRKNFAQEDGTGRAPQSVTQEGKITSESRPKHQRKVKAEAHTEAQDIGLRRSKRIACQKKF